MLNRVQMTGAIGSKAKACHGQVFYPKPQEPILLSSQMRKSKVSFGMKKRIMPQNNAVTALDEFMFCL